MALTTADTLADDAAADESQKSPRDPFVHETTFQACIAADMIVYKLGGFVRDEHGALTDVTETQAVVRLGRRGLFPFWGRSAAWQPVQMTVEFGNEKSTPDTQAKGRVEAGDDQGADRAIGLGQECRRVRAPGQWPHAGAALVFRRRLVVHHILLFGCHAHGFAASVLPAFLQNALARGIVRALRRINFGNSRLAE